MRLARHEELVERIAFVLPLKGHATVDYASARAALDVLLAAVVEMGIGEVSDVEAGATSYVALFIRLEENSHDE